MEAEMSECRNVGDVILAEGSAVAIENTLGADSVDS